VGESHLSIGEVLNLLQDEFPDITISKIRFLESQGLLDPERTPSGYRKFYEADIERLRWILRQQKENFLPLKVIKDRLANGELDDPVAPEPAALVSVPAAVEVARVPERAPVAVGEIDPAPRAKSESGRGRGRADAVRAAASPEAARAGRSRSRRSDSVPAGSGHDQTGVSLTRDEMLASTGLDAKDLAELERFGLVESRSLGNTSYYDEDALLVATLAAGFLGHGVEPRHLRMYKVAAEREAGVFEQLVMPLLKQRNPNARVQATERLDELAELGGRLRSAMLRHSLRDHLGHG
jgi:DNA-binding transcriptional MerR regulator